MSQQIILTKAIHFKINYFHFSKSFKEAKKKKITIKVSNKEIITLNLPSLNLIHNTIHDQQCVTVGKILLSY